MVCILLVFIAHNNYRALILGLGAIFLGENLMKKTALVTAMGIGLGAMGMSTQAALVSGTLLVMAPGVWGCVSGVGTFPDCDYGSTVVAGSYFAMSGARVALHPGTDGGIVIGAAQPGSGSHGGFPDGSETAPLDAPWAFFCNTGLHFTTSPVTVINNDVNNDGGFKQTLDFSGWTVSWNGIPAIPLPGVATITCSLADCALGGTYSLSFAILIPPSTLHNFGGVPYTLKLDGTVAAVPIPAAAWLFGTGLLGLAGAVRRKKT